MNNANTMVMNVPVDVLEIRVYHSGKNMRTVKTSNMTGRQNMMAIGKPVSSLDRTLLSLSRSCSQYTINCLSFSVIMLQN